MKNKIEVIPLVGIMWEGRKICFLDSKKTIVDVLGEPYSVCENKYYYWQNELRIDFDENGKVEFIEFLAGINGDIQPEIYGLSAFGADARVLYDLLKNKNNGDIDDSENGYSYLFLNISIGVYRPLTPDGVEEMIKEAENAGEHMDPEEIEYEMQRATHWATIGIGVKHYYL